MCVCVYVCVCVSYIACVCACVFQKHAGDTLKKPTMGNGRFLHMYARLAEQKGFICLRDLSSWDLVELKRMGLSGLSRQRGARCKLGFLYWKCMCSRIRIRTEECLNAHAHVCRATRQTEDCG